MSSDSLTVLLSSLDRAVTDGLVTPEQFERIELGLTVTARGENVTDGYRTGLIDFLRTIGEDTADYFTSDERSHADQLLQKLESGRFGSLESSAALPVIPKGTSPAVDILIHEPRDSLENLYIEAVQKNIGTVEERSAVEKLLWLRPLESEDYRLVNSFLEKLPAAGIRGRNGQLAQAWYLLDLLAPGANPHELLRRLTESGIASKIRTLPFSKTLIPPATTTTVSLDDMLLLLSSSLREAAEEGDADRVQKLLAVVKNISTTLQRLPKTPRPLPFAPIRGSARLSDAEWETFDNLAATPLMNAVLMPFAVVEHLLAGIVMGELSWKESVDEMVDVMGGSAIAGGTIWGSMAVWNTFAKMVEDKKLGALLRQVQELAPSALKTYLVPALVLSAFTFIALRQTQNLPIDEAGEYRWRYLEEMTEGFSIQLAVTGVSLWGARRILNVVDKVPKGKIGGGILLILATGAGMLAQEIFTSWRRQKFRKNLKEKSYAELVQMLDAFKNYPPYLKSKLQTRIDRKFSLLIALNALEFPSVKEAIKEADAAEERLTHMTGDGVPASEAIQSLDAGAKMEPMTEVQQKIAERWIQKMSGKETTMTLPISMLPAQKRRVIGLWQKDLSDVIQYMVNPVPLEDRQFENWGLAQTMSLLRRYIDLRKEI